MHTSRSFLLFVAALAGSLCALTNLQPVDYWIPAIVTFTAMLLISRSLAAILLLAGMAFCLGYWGSIDGHQSYLNTRTQLQHHQAHPKKPKPIYDGTIQTTEKNARGEWRVEVEVKIPTQLPAFSPDERRENFLNITLYLREGAALLTPKPGDKIRFQSKIRLFEKAPMPGIFDPYWYGYSKSILGSASVYHPYQIIFLSEHAPGILSSLRSNLKHNIQDNLLPRQASLLIALMLGQKASFDDDQKSIYREVGAGYLLAVSGLQVSILAVFLLQVFLYIFLLIPPIGRRNRARTYATYLSLFCIWMFVGIVGWPPSAIRAAIMASSLLIGFLLKREIQAFDALGAAGLFSILLWPNAVTDPGFLLSYAALFGLIIVDRDRNKHAPGRIFAASLSAGLMTLPICAFLFGQVVPTSLITNALIIPVASALQLPAVLLGFIGASLSSKWILELAAFFAGCIEAFCEMVSNFTPGIYWLAIPNAIQLTWIVLATALFVLFLFRYRRWPILAISICFIIIGCKSLIQTTPRLHATFLPVGQGDATFIQFPSGQTMLIDGGGHYRERYNPGESIILPFLKHNGIKHVDIVALTHPDADHILGLIPVINEMDVGEIWHSGFTASHPLMKRLLKAAKNRGIPIHSAKDLPTSKSFGESVIQILAPKFQMDDKTGHNQSVNDKSLVLRIAHQNTSLLMTGDIEKFGESELIRHHPELKSNVVKAPHHGSKSSSTLPFIQSTKPEHVVFCTGRQNRFNFPHFQVLKRWQGSNAKTWNTANDGMVDVWLSENDVEVKGYLHD